MKAAYYILLASTALSSAWTLRGGRPFDADLAAADGLRATFTRSDGRAVVLPLADLSDADRETIGNWRKNPRNPLVLPSRIGPWPAQAVAAKGEVRSLGEDAGRFSYQSPNFQITSDLNIPVSAANDIASVLEATRAALIAIPLGLHAGGERRRYPVTLFQDPMAYAQAGGPEGSGGYYNGRTRQMLILLPNIGIEAKDGRLRLDHRKNLFVLKHEVVHQLMDHWNGRFPVWFSEGIAEFIAALPYSNGTYSLKPPGAGMREYLMKWQPSKNDRRLWVVPPDRLMGINRHQWDAAVSAGNAYDLYNSSALLVYQFIVRDNGTPIAGYLEALRRGVKHDTAERLHLLGDRTWESVTEEQVVLGKALGLDVIGLQEIPF